MPRLERRIRLCALSVALTAALAAPVPASAEIKGTLAMRSTSAVARWSGEFVAGITGATASTPAACTPNTCDFVDLAVSLPPSAWRAPGGMLVAIQWPSVDVGYDLDLFVYAPDGTQAGRSTVVAFSRNESVWIPNPVNGTYGVYVIPKHVIGQTTAPGVFGPLTYQGVARFDYGLTVRREESFNSQSYTKTFAAFGLRSPKPRSVLLPDLVPTKPSNFHIESTWGAQYYFYGDRGVRHQPSCYPQETIGYDADNATSGGGSHPTKCLRWDQGEYNFGDGPFELHNYPDEGAGNEMWQRIYASDGTVRQVQVGEARFSESHGHLHYVGFQDVTLREWRAGGRPGPVVASAPDKGICMVDIENARFGKPRASPHGYGVLGNCDTATHRDPNDPTYPGSAFFQMGISVGYADVYPWFIADQYIDITGVPDGKYLLVVTLDAGKRLVEKSRANNTAAACVQIAGTEARPC